MISVFVLATMPMIQAGLRAMLTSTDIQVVGESSARDAFMEDLAGIDVIVVADAMLLEDAGQLLADDAMQLLQFLHQIAFGVEAPSGIHDQIIGLSRIRRRHRVMSDGRSSFVVTLPLTHQSSAQ